MRVLLVSFREGFGARDHALAWLLAKSPQVTELLVARGNAATEFLPKTQNVYNESGGPWEVYELVSLAIQKQVELVVVGPEEQLADGLVDALEAVGIPAFGPTQAAARLETSKSQAIEWMREAGVPHAHSWIFTNHRKAFKFLRRCQRGVVVKLDGLARGKGVWVCKSKKAAIAAVELCKKQHPKETLVIQELLKGVEVSVFCFTDGLSVSDSIAASDYKQRFDGDEGPNTGSMGSFSPPTFWNERLAERIRRTVLQPIVDVMRKHGITYKGVIYAGLMLTAEGPQVLEFNCRFGDAEGQVILPLLESDPIDVMRACIAGRLHEVEVQWNRSLVAATVVMVHEGYPDSAGLNGVHIYGLDAVEKGMLVFHYGTTLVTCSSARDGRVNEKGECSYVATGGSGRKLSITVVAESLEAALLLIYCTISPKGQGITFEGEDWRGDIGTGRDVPQEWTWVFTG